ncbi:MAG: MlaD family protein [Candidatus Cloacimonetes bacterium]|nr:MlaD family protein [Candidatus Cloacimonadota bacterium]MDY0299128.1 MlaD family protein [Candidatus Cloacimonadaceae bacterium]MCB5278156.1 MlaD family protein [Candidatus Cloacimonadota bacterium]MCK9332208.1 MlaD family protein [Candidatus Cloacimonadota bacterium]MDD2210461.1 MlaD family protein [Candidatus Cloacimonadota bacterium]
MVSKATKVRLGVFLAVGSILILVFAAAVAGNRLTQKWDTYYIVFEDYPVSGLQVGGTVNYQGIKVGRVEDIKIDPDDVLKVRVTINIEPGTPIKENTEAVLSLVGITGLKAVEIRGGTNEARTISPGSNIKAGSTMIDDISERAISIAEKIDAIAQNINEITSEQNRENIAKILDETGAILEITRNKLSGTLDSFNRIANNTANLTEDLSRNLDSITQTLNNSIEDISDSSVESINQIAETLNDELVLITRNLNKTVGDITDQTEYLLQDTRFHLNNIGQNTNTLVLEGTEQIVSISTNINRSLDTINQLLSSDEFVSIVQNIDALSAQLAEANVKEMVSNLGTTIQRTGVLVNTLNRALLRSQDDLLETLENMRYASENLNDFSRQISDNPAILLRGN